MTLFAPVWWFLRCFPLLVLTAVLLGGCTTPTYYPPQPPPAGLPPEPPPTGEIVGSLEATGSNVFYNNRRITGGGHTIRSGDNVSTGPGSRATVRLAGGGVVTIDENTDPNFIQEAFCVLVQILNGQVELEGPGICFDTPEAKGVANSEINIMVSHQETIITVLTGRADIYHPVDLRINPSEQARFAMGRVQQVRTLSRRELQSVFSWIHDLPDQGAELDSRRCRNYAQTAVSQQDENLERQCGFAGIRWLADFDAHYQWCMQVPPFAAERENQARIQALRHRCPTVSPPRDDRQRCEQYAQTAISQQNENLKRRCGFAGGSWSTDFNTHYQWCMQAPPFAAERENQARIQALRHRCPTVSPPTDDRQRCEQYAQTAISQQNENLERQCGFTGNRWSQDFNHHYRWCTQVPQSSADTETMSRRRDLRSCSDSRQPRID